MQHDRLDRVIRIMIVAGEASGDLHAANLVRALRAQLASVPVEFFGLGRSEMAAAGVRLLFDAGDLASIGPIEAIPKLRRYHQCLKGLVQEARTCMPHLVILIDFPDFNLRLAKHLRALGLSIVYYISPQIWAWRKRRIQLIHKYVDKMLVILPFEKDFYAAHGVDVSYVGHPLVHAGSFTFDAAAFRREFNIAPERKLVALLPGSRVREVRYMLPAMLESTPVINAQVPTTFLLAGVADVDGDIYSDYLHRFRSASPDRSAVDIRWITGRTREALCVSDLALVKSGTSTLEALLAGVPFIIVYRISWLSWYIGKLLVDIPHYGLVNLIAGRRVVPELLQGEASPEHIASHALQWLCHPAEMARLRREFQLIKKTLGTSDASQEAARVIVAYLQRGSLPPVPSRALSS